MAEDSEETDYYAVLGVAPDADEIAIRVAYRRLARRYHPDVAGTGSLARMQALNVAYAMLSDPERRRVYDLDRSLATTLAPEPPRTEPHPRAGERHGSVRAEAGPLRRIATLEGAAVPIVACALAPDGVRAAVGLIDGRVGIWDVRASRLIATMGFGSQAGAGVLQEVRLSPGGALAAGWGFSLGLRVWQVEGGRTLWSTAINAPSGLLDAVLADVPPGVRLAVPDAPLALADDDPFRWAHEGRSGSAILSRPLAGPVPPSAAVPVRCVEGAAAGLFRGDGGEWRVQQRLLARDGRALLTVSAGNTPRASNARLLSLWDLEHRTLRGTAEPRRVAHVLEADSALRFPVAATDDLAWVALGDGLRRLRLFGEGLRERHAVEVGELPEDARAALAPGGALLALARGNELALVDMRAGRRLQNWRFAAEIGGLAFAPGLARPLLAVGLANGLAELWA